MSGAAAEPNDRLTAISGASCSIYGWTKFGALPFVRGHRPYRLNETDASLMPERFP